MSFLKIGFLNLSDAIFFAIFILVFIFFLRDFNITSKRSWVVLLGLTALGGAFLWQAWRRNKLLEQLEEREKALDELAKVYEQLKKQAKITEEAYQKAMEDLGRAKVEAGLAIMRADATLAEEAAQIEREYQNLTMEQSLARIKAALKSK